MENLEKEELKNNKDEENENQTELIENPETGEL